MSYRVYPNDGDTITETAETESRARTNSTDYVERGLGVTLNGDGTVDIGSGLAIIKDGTDAWEVEDETGTTNVSLADTTTTNYIYITFDPTANDVENSVSYHVDTDQSAPSNPSLLIATADESTSTVNDKNPNPDASFESVDTDQVAVGGQPNINYWPPEPVHSDDVNDSSPPTSYTTATLSSLPSDAKFAFIDVVAKGDGSADAGEVRIREAGSSRTFDVKAVGWAGHNSFNIGNNDIVPVNSSQQIEYIDKNNVLSQIIISVTGYF